MWGADFPWPSSLGGDAYCITISADGNRTAAAGEQCDMDYAWQPFLIGLNEHMEALFPPTPVSMMIDCLYQFGLRYKCYNGFPGFRESNLLAISADGLYLAVGGVKVTLFNLTNAKPSTGFPLPTSSPMWNYPIGKPVNWVSISADGAYIVAGGKDDPTIYVFKKESPTPQWRFLAGGNVSSVVISADGDSIVAGCNDNHIYFFNSQNSNPLWTHSMGGNIVEVAISANGVDFVAGTNSSLSFYEIIDETPPRYSHEKESLSSPQFYHPSKYFQFNLTITDDVGLDTILFEWNGTLYPITSHSGDEYYLTLYDLGVGTYQYRWLFNDTFNNWNSTIERTYIITPNPLPFAQFLFDGVALQDHFNESILTHYYQTDLATPSYNCVWLQPALSSSDFNLYLYSDINYSSLEAFSTRGPGLLDWVLFRSNSSPVYYPKAEYLVGSGNAFIGFKRCFPLSMGVQHSGNLNSSNPLDIYRVYLTDSIQYNFTLNVPGNGDYDLFLFSLSDGDFLNCSRYIQHSETAGNGMNELIWNYTPMYSDFYAIVVVWKGGNGTYYLTPSFQLVLSDDSTRYDYYDARNSYYYQTGNASSAYYQCVWLQPLLPTNDFNLLVYSDSAYSDLRISSNRGAGSLDWVVFRPSTTQIYYPKVDRYLGTGYATIQWEDSSTLINRGTNYIGSLNSSECIETYMVELFKPVPTCHYQLYLDVPSGADYDLYLYDMSPGGAANSSGYYCCSTNVGLGVDEFISFLVNKDGYYAIIVVWKSGSGNYNLGIPYLHYLDADFAHYGYYDIPGTYFYQTAPVPFPYYNCVWLQPCLESNNLDLYLYSDDGYSSLLASSTREAGLLDWVVFRSNAQKTYYPRVNRYSGTGYGYIEWEYSWKNIALGYNESGFMNSSECVETYMINLASGCSYLFYLDVPSGCDFDLYMYSLSPASVTNCSGYYKCSTAIGLGVDEYIITYINSSDYYAIMVVWKSGSGNYILRSSFTTGDLLPPGITLTSVSPTFSNGLTTITVTNSTADFNANGILANVSTPTGGWLYPVMTYQGSNQWRGTFTVTANGLYTVRVNATDKAGNKAYAGPISITGDITPPFLAIITSPAGGAFVNGTICVNATAVDAIGIKNVTFYRDAAVLLGTAINTPYGVQWNTTGLGGMHILYVRAFDNAGNYRTSTNISVTVDNTLLVNPYPKDLRVSPMNPIYSQNQFYQFNCTWTDDVELDTVLFNFNGVNYTNVGHMGSEYFYTLFNLPANENGYLYLWFANDTAGNWGTTPLNSYIINKKIPEIQLLLNSESENYTINQWEYINISTSLLEASNCGNFTIYINGSARASSSFTTQIESVLQFPAAGNYNVTCSFFGNQNLTTQCQTYWLVVRDIEPPQMIHFPNLTFLNCTALEYHHSGLRIAVNVSDNMLVNHIILCENSTGSFINRSIRNSMGNRHWINLAINGLKFGEGVAYWFYANDTNNNWGIKRNLNTFYMLRIGDSITPSACELDYSIVYAPDFVLENTLFTISGGTDFGGSGIDYYQYKWDSGQWVNGPRDSFSGLPNGIHTLFYSAVDKAGNSGLCQNITVYFLAYEADYDNDSLTNFAEIFTYRTNIFKSDTDGDGLLDFAEIVQYKTNPNNPDTDSDGISDGAEISLDANPLDPGDPLIGRIILIIEIIMGCILSVVIIRIVKKEKNPLSFSRYALIAQKNQKLTVFQSLINALPSLQRIFVEKEKIKIPMELQNLSDEDLFAFFETIIGWVPETEIRTQMGTLLKRKSIAGKKERLATLLINLKEMFETTGSPINRDLLNRFMQLLILIKTPF